MFHFAAAPEALVCAGAGISTFLLSWKQVKLHRSHLTILPKQNACDLLSLQSKFGYNEHSFVGISVQPEVWSDGIHDGGIAYNETGRVWVVAGEPLGQSEDLPAITANFIKHARSRKKIVAFLPTTEKFARSVSDQNVRIVKVGASPYFDLENWDPRGNSAKKLRLGVNRGRRSGVEVTEVTDVTESFRAEVEDLTSQWGGCRKAGVSFGWLFALVPFQNSNSKKYFAARTPDGKLVGLLAASPIPARDGWYLEDVLRSSDSPDGTSDLLVFETLKMLAAQGAKLATLGTVPLSAKGCDDLSAGRNKIVERSLTFSRKHLNSLYNFDGLGAFKSKFVPSWWESEYVVVSKGRLIPPRVANAVFNVIVPGGFVQILQLLLSAR